MATVNLVGGGRGSRHDLTPIEQQIAADLVAKFYKELEGEESQIAIAAARALLGRVLGDTYKTDAETRKAVRVLVAENMVRIAHAWRCRSCR